jgi:hypothetical protein
MSVVRKIEVRRALWYSGPHHSESEVKSRSKEDGVKKEKSESQERSRATWTNERRKKSCDVSDRPEFQDKQSNCGADQRKTLKVGRQSTDQIGQVETLSKSEFSETVRCRI